MKNNETMTKPENAQASGFVIRISFVPAKRGHLSFVIFLE